MCLRARSPETTIHAMPPGYINMGAKTSWADIQLNWANGNRNDAREMLMSQPKIGIIKIVYDALKEGEHFTEWMTHGQLLELLQTILDLRGLHENNHTF